MKFPLSGICLYLFLFLQIPLTAGVPEKTSLQGKVTDAATGEPLAGVSIYLPDMKTGTSTSFDGTYKLENLPKRVVVVQVTYLGYKPILEKIDLNVDSRRDFALQSAVTEMHEVVVTGSSQAVERTRTPTPVTVVQHIDLLQTSSTNIISSLTSQPGISQVTTGAGISKPVIRGLGYNRVVVVNDGIRQEGQQWGDEHGIEIDEFSVDKVEILKGPASLSYGSDAMAGVINMLSTPTLPDGKMAGNLLANYQTNNGLISFSGNFMGNRRGLIWDIRYSNKMAHAYQNKYDGYVFNSGFRENTIGGIVGLSKHWGYSHLHFSAYNMTPGIVEGERDSLSGQFLKPVAIDENTEGSVLATDSDFHSYTPGTPFQKIHHYKAVLNNSIIVGESTLKATIGFQQNQRQEFADVLAPDQYGLYFLLNTVNYNFQYIFPEQNHFNVSVGVNGMRQTSKNKGSEFLVPEYSLFDAGFFVIGKKSIGDLDLSGGLRFDSRSEHTKDLYLNEDEEKVDGPGPGIVQRFKAFDGKFTGGSGSVGATYQFSESLYAKLNVSRGYRAPNIAELGSNGVHEGTVRYEIGDPNLKPEGSWEGDIAFGMNKEHVTAEISLFDNYIRHFIFSRKLVDADGRDSITDGYQTFKYVSGNANLFGGEITVDVHPHPLDWLHIENSFSYVQAVQPNEPDSTKYLPFIPGAKFSIELRAEANKLGKHLAGGYMRIRLDNFFAQDRFYSAFGTETRTPGYSLMEVGMGASVVRKGRKICSVFINANNLTNVAYQSHLSRLKYGPENFATGRTGVFDMGHNFSFKVLVPL